MNDRRETVQQQLRKKHDAEERALQVVVALLETGISRVKLVDAAKCINVDYYSDVTAERAISLTCGYPLCDNPLTNVPKQKYRISLRQKKVYDLSELRNFCSDRCFRASKYFESQLSTSPVWAFDAEPDKEQSNDRPCRPVLIDDDRMADRTHNCQIGRWEEGTASPSYQEVDSAAVVVSVRDIAARTDDPQQSLERAAGVVIDGEPDAEPLTSVDAGDRLKSHRTAHHHQKSDPELTAGFAHPTAPATKAAYAALIGKTDNDSPCGQSRQLLPSRSCLSRSPSESVPAQLRPLQTALNRLLEWRTTATTAWLLRDAATNSPSEKGTATRLEKSQQPALLLPVDSPHASEGPTPSEQENGAHPKSEPIDMRAGVEYRQRAVRFLMGGNSSATAAAAGKEPSGDRTPDDKEADDWRTVPPSDAHGQDSIRRRLVTERLSKSLGHAEAVVGSDLIDSIRSRNLSRLASSFRLTKDNVTLRPTEWLIVMLLLAYVITLDDESANQKVRTALIAYGCTMDNFCLIKEKFVVDCFEQKAETL